MARVTVEDCLENVANRFELVMLATKRARHLATGGAESELPRENDKDTVLALREIAEGNITVDFLDRDLKAEAEIEEQNRAIDEMQRQQNTADDE